MEYAKFITPDGKEHVVIPMEDYNALVGGPQNDGWTRIPNDVSYLVMDGVPALKAWRKHFKFTQAEVAEKMSVTRDNYKHYETAAKPRRDTLIKAAHALGIEPRQLIELYYDGDESTPPGWTPATEDELD